MGNVWNIARKEFVDLLSSRMVLIVLVAFLFCSVTTSYTYYRGVNNLIPGGVLRFIDNPGVAADNFVFTTMSLFGVVIGIVIGCSSISSERIGNALNTLAAKPLYRITIINGKLVGMLLFLVCTMVFFTAVFTLVFLTFCGNVMSPHLWDYASRLPFVIVTAMAYVLVFLALSMLVALIVRNQAFAMILSTVCVLISDNMPLYNIADYLEAIFPGQGLKDLCYHLSPHGLISFSVQEALMNTSINAVNAFSSILPQLAQLLAYATVFLGLSYIVFVRSDIS
jgi:ABC-2 type transport system permease protein